MNRRAAAFILSAIGATLILVAILQTLGITSCWHGMRAVHLSADRIECRNP